MEKDLVRLQKYIAESGVCSRRKAEELILNNKVAVNGKIINELGYKIQKSVDVVKVDHEVIKPEEAKVYYMLNKPIGYITTSKEQFNRPTVLDLIKTQYRVYPIGRLDYDTSGLLLLTNDGEVANNITHPKFNINKTYLANVKGLISKSEIKRFEDGLKIEDYTTAPAVLNVIETHNSSSIVEITIHEGRNRQVRKMCHAIGHNIISLKRISIGEIKLDNLKEGKYRELTPKEVEYLKTL